MLSSKEHLTRRKEWSPLAGNWKIHWCMLLTKMALLMSLPLTHTRAPVLPTMARQRRGTRSALQSMKSES
jgi:hypothetical protein